MQKEMEHNNMIEFTDEQKLDMLLLKRHSHLKRS